MFVAVPHLSGDEQLRALIEVDHGSISLNLINALKPAKATVVECLLQEALSKRDPQRTIRLLSAINHSGSPLTATATCIISELLAAPEKHIRAEALGIAASSENEALLKCLAESDWNAGRLSAEEDYFELWYGSAALIAAVSAGDLEIGDALDRIAMSHFGFAAERLGSKAASMIADRLEIALGKVLNASEQADIPEIEQEIATSASSLPPVTTLRENTSPADARAAFQSLTESEEQFQSRQRRLRRAYARFSKELTNADARLVVTDLTVEGMAAIAAERPDIISGWHSLLLAAKQEKKRSLHMFAMHFAAAIAEKHAELAVSIIRAYSTEEPLVRHVVGMAKIPIETEVLWSCGRIPQVAVECTQRLEDCISDREMAMEVLAAFKHDQQNILKSYTKQLIDTGEPVHIARALTVAGFSDESEFASNILSRFNGAKGFVGEACEAAQGAYDRNRWARHWYELLRSTRIAVDFWRYSVLLSKIVDGRFDLWGTGGPTEELFTRFFPTIEGEVRQRIKKWNEKRKDKLFGNKVPHVVFLIRDFSGD